MQFYEYRFLQFCADGSAEVAKVDVQGAVLGGGTPALSDAAGAFMGQDMMGMEDEWPQARLDDSSKLNNWLHSDMEIVAYPFTHKLYDSIAGSLH
jgi:hypothetical protein